MPGEEQPGRTDDPALARWRSARALQGSGPRHTSQDCRELVTRLKAQAECLEEILAGIRAEIDELECDEILDHIREELFEANT